MTWMNPGRTLRRALVGVGLLAAPASAQQMPPGVGLSTRAGVYEKVSETTASGTVTYLRRWTRTQPREVLDRTERIIERSELGSVGADLEARYRPVLDAIGWVKPMGCTATHIGQGLVLTAQHCFTDRPLTGTVNQPCDGVTIQWGYREGAGPALVSRCEVILAAEFSDTRDFALLRVSPVPAAHVTVSPSPRPAPGTRLTLFSHPRGRPLEWSGTCALRPALDGGYTSRAMFTHQCDTEPGSGGAAVLNDETLQIVGIHGGGEITEVNKDNRPVGWNFATFLSDIPLPPEALPQAPKKQKP